MRTGGLPRIVAIGWVVVDSLRLTGQPVTADEAVDDINAVVESQFDDSRVPGATIAIVQDGELAYAWSFAIDDGFAMTAQTPFPIGSLTKSFTELAVMQRCFQRKGDLR